MPIRKVTDNQLGIMTTSKILALTSAETLYVVGTANRAFEATNLGVYSVYYGGSGVLVDSGGLIGPGGSKMWDSVVDNFSLYFVVASGGVTSNLLIQEYPGL